MSRPFFTVLKPAPLAGQLTNRRFCDPQGHRALLTSPKSESFCPGPTKRTPGPSPRAGAAPSGTAHTGTRAPYWVWSRARPVPWARNTGPLHPHRLCVQTVRDPWGLSVQWVQTPLVGWVRARRGPWRGTWSRCGWCCGTAWPTLHVPLE